MPKKMWTVKAQLTRVYKAIRTLSGTGLGPFADVLAKIGTYSALVLRI